MSNIKNQIRVFIVENYLFGDDEGLTDETSFLGEGIIDSTGVLELVRYLDEAFGVIVGDEELLPENLDSLNKLDAFVQSKLQSVRETKRA